MKRLLVLFTLIAFGGAAMAQANGGLQGPAAKNYKYWLDKNKPVATAVVTTDQKPLIGPAAKNKQWHRQREEYNYVAVETVTARPRIIGPNAKHVRPYHFRHMRPVSELSEEENVNFTSTKEPQDLNK